MKPLRRYISARPQLRYSMLAGDIHPRSALAGFQQQDVWLTLKARTAIYQAACLTGLDNGGEVLVPAYHCGSEVDALVKSGATISFYGIDATAQIDLVDLERRITPSTRAVYVIHYFGIAPPMAALRALCDHYGLWLIEDRALNSLSAGSSKEDGHHRGDLVVYSFTKPLPLTDGGALMVHHPDLAARRWSLRRSSSPVRITTLLKRAAAAQVRRWSHQPVHRSAPETASWMPAGYHFDTVMADAAISNTALRMLWRLDAAAVTNACRQNFLQLHESLRPHLKRPRRLSALAPGASPLLYPLLTDNRFAVIQRLHARGVEALPFWAGYHPHFSLDEFPDARRLKNNLLGLPIHQDLDESDIHYIANETIHAIKLT